MKKNGKGFLIAGFILYILGFVGGTAFRVFQLIAGSGHYFLDGYIFDWITILAIINLTLSVIISMLIIIFTIVELAKAGKNKPAGAVGVLLMIMSSMQIWDVVNSLWDAFSVRFYNLTDQFYRYGINEMLTNYVASGSLLKAIGCLLIVIGVARMLLKKREPEYQDDLLD